MRDHRGAGHFAYTDALGNAVTFSRSFDAEATVQNVNDTPAGRVVHSGAFREDEIITIDASQLDDEDGIALIEYKLSKRYHPHDDSEDGWQTTPRVRHVP